MRDGYRETQADELRGFLANKKRRYVAKMASRGISLIVFARGCKLLMGNALRETSCRARAQRGCKLFKTHALI